MSSSGLFLVNKLTGKQYGICRELLLKLSVTHRVLSGQMIICLRCGKSSNVNQITRFDIGIPITKIKPEPFCRSQQNGDS